MENFSVEMLKLAFPQELSEDAAIVAQYMPKEICADGSFCKYKLPGKETIWFPYRIYDAGKIGMPSGFSVTQKMIFHAFLSRSNDGYLREKHLHKILDMNYPAWVFPYILKLSDEYVAEILELIYSYLKNKDCQKIKDFCKLNAPSFVRSYDRMTSYWGEFYCRDTRYSGPFSQYVGKRLFCECYGYHKSLRSSLK